MAEQLVATVRTNPSLMDFSKSLILAVPGISKEAAGVLYAQFAGETGKGVHCYGHNLGNVKYSKGCGYNYHALNGVWEGVTPAQAQALIASGQAKADPSKDHAKAVGPGKVSVLFTASHPASWFRAYPSLEKGMQVFVAAKKNPTSRYASAWAYLLAGDCMGYAQALYSKGYFTASPKAYGEAMLTYHKMWMASSGYEDALEALNVSLSPEEMEHDPSEETMPTVDVVSGETWVLDFEIVHPRVPLPEPSRCPDCGFTTCQCDNLKL